jgi:hypothetical protein
VPAAAGWRDQRHVRALRRRRLSVPAAGWTSASLPYSPPAADLTALLPQLHRPDRFQHAQFHRVRGADPDSFTYIPEQFNNNVVPAVISFQCNLPPGGAIHDMYVILDEDVGQ